MRQLLTEMREILPKPKVAGSNPVCRSKIPMGFSKKNTWCASL